MAPAGRAAGAGAPLPLHLRGRLPTWGLVVAGCCSDRALGARGGRTPALGGSTTRGRVRVLRRCPDPAGDSGRRPVGHRDASWCDLRLDVLDRVLTGLLVACLIFALVLTLAWSGLGPWIAAALVGGALGVLVALSAYIGLLPGSRVVDLPAEWLQVGGWNGVVLDLAISALVGGALFLLAKAWPTLSFFADRS